MHPILHSIASPVRGISDRLSAAIGRRRLPALGLLCVWALVANVPTNARAAQSLALGSGEAGPGEEVRLELRFAPESDPVALQCDVRFDAARLAPGFAVAGPAAGGYEIRSALPESGVLRVIVYSSRNRTIAGGVVALLPFRVLTGAPEGATALVLSNVVVSSAAAARLLPVSTQAGAVTIRDSSGPAFRRPVLAANGRLELVLNAQDGRTYALQVSGDLKSWQTLATSVASGGTAVFGDTPSTTGGPRFYRALLVP
ncbi:MAG: hypothetical protein JNL97_10365 [Verrucomicrobiales bacterium]|nr:hypothetical protein [Verrucomicrobiales bacterium]